MNQLLENRTSTAPNPGDDCQCDSAAIEMASDLPSIDAQAAYQIALTQIRLHRNRWKASGSNQTSFDQTSSDQREFDRSRARAYGGHVGDLLMALR